MCLISVNRRASTTCSGHISVLKSYFQRCYQTRLFVLFLQLSSRLLNWLFCGPCIQFLKTSTTFHKMTLTGVTLLVTSLLVASPILFLISAAPSMPHRDGCATNDDCIVNLPPPECQETICKTVAASIQSKINWKSDVCKDFKAFSCSTQQSSLRIMKSPQEIADHQMLRKFNFPLVNFPTPFSTSLNPICLHNDFEFLALELFFYPPHHCQTLSLLQY